MSADGEPDFSYHIFDTLQDLHLPFKARLNAAHAIEHPYAYVVPHTMVHNLNDLSKYEAHVLELGYEGIMLRHPEA